MTDSFLFHFDRTGTYMHTRMKHACTTVTLWSSMRHTLKDNAGRYLIIRALLLGAPLPSIISLVQQIIHTITREKPFANKAVLHGWDQSAVVCNQSHCIDFKLKSLSISFLSLSRTDKFNFVQHFSKPRVTPCFIPPPRAKDSPAYKAS